MRAAQRRGQAKGESKQNLGPGQPFPLLLSFCPSSFYRGREKGPGSTATLYPVWLVLYLVVGSYWSSARRTVGVGSSVGLSSGV